MSLSVCVRDVKVIKNLAHAIVETGKCETCTVGQQDKNSDKELMLQVLSLKFIGQASSLEIQAGFLCSVLTQNFFSEIP